VLIVGVRNLNAAHVLQLAWTTVLADIVGGRQTSPHGDQLANTAHTHTHTRAVALRKNNSVVAISSYISRIKKLTSFTGGKPLDDEAKWATSLRTLY